MREIKNYCLHKVGYLFTLDYSPSRHYSTLTGSEDAKCIINRYCKECREQMGCVDVSDDPKSLSRVEFASPELAEWFAGQKGE